MEKEKKFDKLEKISLSDAESLLSQEMDEVIGGDINYNCYCPNSNGGAKSV